MTAAVHTRAQPRAEPDMFGMDPGAPGGDVAALLVANVKSLLRPQWHWLAETHGASFAWGCNFYDGNQGGNRKSFEGSAVAVRLISLIA